jgi:hypothetical protein
LSEIKTSRFRAGGIHSQQLKGTNMKKVLFIFLAMAMAFVLMGFTPSNAPAQASWVNQTTYAIATDSVVTNAGTKYSQIIQMQLKTTKQLTSVNYLDGLKILVTGYQIRDSVNAEVSLQVGQVAGGTLNKQYTSIVIDTLTSTKKYLIIDLSSYLLFPQARLKVTGLAAGNGSTSYPAVWNARACGIGRIYSVDEITR